MVRKKDSPSRTDLKKNTPDEIAEKHGLAYLLEVVLKSQKTHDSSRNERRKLQNSKWNKKTDDD